MPALPAVLAELLEGQDHHKLLAAHHLSTGLDLCPYSRSDGLAFPESP